MRSVPTSPPRLIIFDFDGTLVDSLQAGFQLLQKLQEQYKFRKINTFKDYQDLNKLSLPRIFLKLRISPFTLFRLLVTDYKMGIEMLRDCHPYHGVEESVTQLAKNHTLAIVTSNIGKAVESYLEEKNLRHHFGLVLGAEHNREKVPKIHKCLEHFEVEAHEAVFIGDSVRDIRDSKKVPIRSIAVTYGIHSEYELKKEKPNLIVETALKIPAAILQLA